MTSPGNHHDELLTHNPEYHFLGKDLSVFSKAGFDMDKIHLKRNASVAELYEEAISKEGAVISSNGALINFSGKKTGRSPKDKRVVFEETSKDDVWVSSICSNRPDDDTDWNHSLFVIAVGPGEHQDGRAHFRDQP